jgi:hypothetical protein
MTATLALRCREGVVLATDSRETTAAGAGRIAHDATKITKPRPGFLVAAAGFRSVTQAFVLALQRARDLSPSADRVEVQQRLRDVIQQIRAQGATDIAEWTVAWWSRPDDAPVALQLFSGGSSQWIEDWGFGGDRRPWEIASIVAQTLRFVPREALTLEQAKLLALKVMRDTIHIGVESIGGAVQLAAVSHGTVEILAGARLEAMHDTLDVWEEQAAALLPGIVALPAESATVDRGVRPPPAIEDSNLGHSC